LLRNSLFAIFNIALKKRNIYTPRHLVEKILTTRSSIQGERKFVTVFFADVADYTSISEQLDPEESHQIMDGCFKILMDEICRELRTKPDYALGHLVLGEHYINADQKEIAIKNLRKAEGLFQEMDMDYWLSKTQGLLTEL
jgi:hypothetical protein